MSRAIVAVFAVAILGMSGIYAADIAFQESGRDVLITNESYDPGTGGTIVTLNDSNKDGAFYDERVDVYDINGTPNDQTDDTEVENGTDYRWFQNNGTIKTLSGGELAGDSEAWITYGYDQTNADQRGMASGLATLYSALEPIVFIGIGVLFLIAVRGGM